MRITFRPQYGDLKIIYAFGSESLADTVSNIYLAGDRVTNEELQDQFHSLSDRLLEGMPEDPGGELGNDAGVAAQEGLCSEKE